MDLEPLTDAQAELYRWLVDFIREKHYSPTLREAMLAMNLRSPAPVQFRLNYLRKKGYVDWIDGQPRTIQITGGEARPVLLSVPAKYAQRMQDFLDVLESGDVEEAIA